MRSIKNLTAVCLMAAVTACSSMSSPSTSAMSNGPHGQRFVNKVASSDQFEIQSSRLALKRSHNSTVRDIARHLITDHTNSSNKLMAIAANDGLERPTGALTPEQRTMLSQLRSSSHFDRDYLKDQDTAHQQAIDAFENYRSNGLNPHLRHFADKTLPTLNDHLRMVQSAE